MLIMKKHYNVHLYQEMRLYFPGIEAGTPEEAARVASDKATEGAESVNDCNGEIFAALVDVAGDDTFEHSVTIDFEGERERKAGRAALLLLDLIRHGAIGLGDGEVEFNGTTHAFDKLVPDWHAVVDAIGWENATAAVNAGSKEQRHDGRG